MAKLDVWEDRNVLIGTLHNEQQLDINLRHQFYHIPAAVLSEIPQKVKYIALYQSRRLFDRQAGVRYWAPVKGISLVKRGEIKEIPTRNPDELYYRFFTREWQERKPPILARGIAPGVSMFTTTFLLQGSRVFPELFIRCPEHYRIYRYLWDAYARTRSGGGSVEIDAHRGYRVLVSGRVIGIYTPDGRYEQRDIRQFYTAPHSFLSDMQAYILPDRG